MAKRPAAARKQREMRGGTRPGSTAVIAGCGWAQAEWRATSKHRRSSPPIELLDRSGDGSMQSDLPTRRSLHAAGRRRRRDEGRSDRVDLDARRGGEEEQSAASMATAAVPRISSRVHGPFSSHDALVRAAAIVSDDALTASRRRRAAVGRPLR